MKIDLKKFAENVSENCVSIILNTHRTSPDNKKDSINLKNLVKEAENRLLADESKRDAQFLIKRVRELEAKIDHSKNLESLVIFVNEEVAEYTRLPISVEDRVIIDETFATRDIVRALRTNTNYLVLVLSRQKVRLIEAINDKVVREIGKPFPIENTKLYSTNRAEQSNATRQTNLVAEFFNRIDKEVNKLRKENPIPVLICSEESNYNEYLKIADERNSIFDTYLNQNRIEQKAHHIIEEAWKIVKEYTENKNKLRKEELKKAVGTGLFLADVNEIWKAANQSKIQTLFIEENLFQPGYMSEEKITFVPEEERTKKGVVDDIYDEIIEKVLEMNADVVFLPKDELKDFAGIGASLKY